MSHKILLAAGGTGGHIIPSIAFGKYLQEQGESVIWLSGSRALEGEIYKAHGVSPIKLDFEGSPLGVSGARALKRWGQLVSSFFRCRSILKKEGVDAGVLFGGYLSLPVMAAAKSLGIKVLMHEQNAVAGKVTRLAYKLNVPITCAWEECSGLPEGKTAFVGMPLRQIKLKDKKQAQKELLGYSLPEGEKLVVILGGSLGSGGMKKVLQDAQNMLKSTSYRIMCMGIRESEKPFPEALTHGPLWDMSPVYSAADVVVCRAGASTLAEIMALKVPTVVVPWLRAADNHQVSNAKLFSKLTGAPTFIENSSQDSFLSALASAPERGACGDMCAGQRKLYKVLRSLID